MRSSAAASDEGTKAPTATAAAEARGGPRRESSSIRARAALVSPAAAERAVGATTTSLGRLGSAMMVVVGMGSISMPGLCLCVWGKYPSNQRSERDTYVHSRSRSRSATGLRHPIPHPHDCALSPLEATTIDRSTYPAAAACASNCTPKAWLGWRHRRSRDRSDRIAQTPATARANGPTTVRPLFFFVTRCCLTHRVSTSQASQPAPPRKAGVLTQPATWLARRSKDGC